MKHLVSISILSFLFSTVHGQLYNVELFTELPSGITPQLSYVKPDGSLLAYTDYINDTTINGEHLDFYKKFPDNDWRANWAYNYASFEYNKNGTALFAERSSIYGYPYIDTSGIMYYIRGEKNSGWFYVQDPKGKIIHKNELLNNGTIFSLEIDKKDGDGFAAIVATNYGTPFYVKTTNGYDTITPPKGYLQCYYLLEISMQGEVERVYFAFGENDNIATNINGNKTNVLKRGDSVWYFEGTYIQNDLLMQDNTYYPTGNQGVIMSFYKGKMVHYNLHHVNHPDYPNSPNLYNLETHQFFDATRDGHLLICNTSFGLSAFYTRNVENTKWVHLKTKKFQGDYLPVGFRPDNAPFVSKSGLIHRVGSIAIPSHSLPKQFANTYDKNDLSMVTYNPENGDVVNHVKLASDVYTYMSYPIGEDANGNLYVYLLTSSYVIEDTNTYRFKYMKINGKKYTNNKGYILKLKRIKNVPDKLNKTNLSCQSNKAEITTDPIVVADSIKINWGDGKSVVFKNQHRARHFYQKPGLYIVNSQVFNGQKKYTQKDTIIVYLPNESINQDTVTFTDSTTVTLADLPGIKYEWSNGQSGKSANFYKTGTYWVKTTIDSCVGYDTLYAIKQIDDNIDQAELIFELYPNPAKEIVQLRINQLPEGNYTLTILDINGKEVIEKRISTADTDIQISTAFLHPGIYQIRIQSQEKSSSKRLAISK